MKKIFLTILILMISSVYFAVPPTIPPTDVTGATAAVTLTLTGQCSSAADSIVIYSWKVFWSEDL